MEGRGFGQCIYTRVLMHFQSWFIDRFLIAFSSPWFVLPPGNTIGLPPPILWNAHITAAESSLSRPRQAGRVSLCPSDSKLVNVLPASHQTLWFIFLHIPLSCSHGP